MGNIFGDYVSEVCGILGKAEASGANGARFERGEAAAVIIDKIKRIKDDGKTICFVGNGASCSMAEHMSHDFFKNAGVNTLTCAETAHITAISNDMSFDMVFAYRIGRVLREGDALVAISSSGNSPSVINAIMAAQKNGAYVITLSGMKDNNKARNLGDMNIYVPAPTYGLAESAHAVLLHAMLDGFLDKYEGGRL